MRKVFVLALVTTVFGGLFAFQGDVDAQRRRRVRRVRLEANEPPVSAEISKALTVPWGAGHAQVIQHHVKALREEFQPRLAKAPGAIEEDRLRGLLDREIAKIRDSYVEFRNQRTGWGVSFISQEFAPNSGEAMLKVDEPSNQRFYFFKNDRLYKMFIAFNADVFGGLNFEEFAERIQQRYGPAQRVTRTNPRTQVEELVELRWQDEQTRLAAIDQTDFYGIFSLRFTDKNVPAELAGARARQRGVAHDPLIDRAIREGSGDAHADVVDRITGRRRAAPGGTAAQQATTKQGRPASQSTAPAAARPAVRDDPMAGLDDL